jgi:hypothetical protein
MPDEYSALAVAVLVFLVVLVAVYMALQLRTACGHRHRRVDGFLGEFFYRPSCGSCSGGVSSCGCGKPNGCGESRVRCRLISGVMPAIETAGAFGCDGGCNRLGVPP